jgi:HSP20 family protein
MAQNDPQGMEAAGASGTSGSRGSTETGGSSTSAKNAPPQESEQGQTASPAIGTTGREQEQGQARGRLTRREGWEDQVGTFFGGSPFALFRRLSDDMDRLFFGGGPNAGAFGGLGGRFVPNIDVEERDDKILVRADLPGVRPDDFHVDIEDDALVLQGERRSEHEETRGGVRRVERSHGSFRRVIPLPKGANLEAADARFENGVLEIQIPLQQESKSRRLEIRSGGSPGSSDTTKH